MSVALSNDYTLEVRLPRQNKEYYMSKLTLITFPEDIEELSIIVEKESGKGKQELDEEKSLTEASKYTQFIAECTGLKKFLFQVSSQQYFMDYSDLLFYSLESRQLQEVSLSLSGLSKSKDTLAKILRSVRNSKRSIKKLSIDLHDIFLSEETFTQLLLLIKNSPVLEQLSLKLQVKHFIQLEKIELLLKILESAENLKSLSLNIQNIRFLRGQAFPLEGKGKLEKLYFDISDEQLFDNSILIALINNNQQTLKEVSLKLSPNNSFEEICYALFHLPNLTKLHFECPRYLRIDQYKIFKNFVCKKSSLAYVTIKLDQAIDIFYDRSLKIFMNLPNLCSFKEISSEKLKKREPAKKMYQYFIDKYLTFRKNYIYTLQIIKTIRKNNKKLFPRGVWEDILNDYVTLENLDQLIGSELKQKNQN